MLRPLRLTGFLIIALGTSLAAQQARPTFEPWEAPSSPLPQVQFGATSRSDTLLAPRRDYRYEGLLVGELSLGLAGAWAGSQISGPCLLAQGGSCGNDKVGTAVALGLLGAVVGGGVGYLVGRLSPKPVSRDSLLPSQPFRALPGIPDSLRRRVGYQHWRGGGLGLAIGGAVGALAGAVLGTVIKCDDCSHQPNAGDGALSVGLVGAGAGGVLGFLVGLSSPRYRMIPTTNAER
jgi:hypothetical protein